jgi:glycogen(starch) synthase
MRVALLSRELPTSSGYTGGIGTYFAALADELARQGHSVLLITDAVNDGYLPSDTGRGRVRVHTVPSRPIPCLGMMDAVVWGLRFDRALRQLGSRSGRPDVIVAPEYGAWAWRIAIRRRRPPVVTGLHTSLQQIREIEPMRDQSPQRRVRDRVQMLLERSQTRHSNALIAVSRAIARWSVESWGIAEDRITVIPNFVSADDLEVDRRTSPSRPPVVAFVGRVCSWKGADVLLRAMLVVWEQFPDAEVILAGRVDQLDGVPAERWIATHMGAHARQITLTGHIARSETVRILTQATVAAYPSLFEAFGLAALEAKYIGVPIIATTGSGFSDFCEDGVDSILVSPGRPDELAAALCRLLTDQGLRAELGGAAALSARTLTAQTVGLEVDATLRRIVSSCR